MGSPGIIEHMWEVGLRPEDQGSTQIHTWSGLEVRNGSTTDSDTMFALLPLLCSEFDLEIAVRPCMVTFGWGFISASALAARGFVVSWCDSVSAAPQDS